MADKAMEPLVGWCRPHDAAAIIYDDGSVTCMHLLIIESSGYCNVEPISPDRLYTAGPSRGGAP